MCLSIACPIFVPWHAWLQSSDNRGWTVLDYEQTYILCKRTRALLMILHCVHHTCTYSEVESILLLHWMLVIMRLPQHLRVNYIRMIITMWRHNRYSITGTFHLEKNFAFFLSPALMGEIFIPWIFVLCWWFHWAYVKHLLYSTGKHLLPLTIITEHTASTLQLPKLVLALLYVFYKPLFYCC